MRISLHKPKEKGIHTGSTSRGHTGGFRLEKRCTNNLDRSSRPPVAQKRNTLPVVDWSVVDQTAELCGSCKLVQRARHVLCQNIFTVILCERQNICFKIVGVAKWLSAWQSDCRHDKLGVGVTNSVFTWEFSPNPSRTSRTYVYKPRYRAMVLFWAGRVVWSEIPLVKEEIILRATSLAPASVQYAQPSGMTRTLCWKCSTEKC